MNEYLLVLLVARENKLKGVKKEFEFGVLVTSNWGTMVAHQVKRLPH